LQRLRAKEQQRAKATGTFAKPLLSIWLWAAYWAANEVNRKSLEGEKCHDE
jgi:hypothetical protein